MQYNPRTLGAIAAAGLIAACAAQANKGAEYKPAHHPHHKNHFLTGGATYLEPSFNGLNYAALLLETPIGAPPTLELKSVEPGFDWGYFIQGGYRISHHYDVQASWAQYNSNLKDTLRLDGSDVDLISVKFSNGDGGPISAGDVFESESKQKLSYSVFDANLGQYHDITEMLRTRLFAGLRYAQIDSVTKNVYAGNFIPPFTENYYSSFSGVGPELGLDLEYKIWHTIGVVGHLAGSLLVGQLEASSQVYNDDYDTAVATAPDTVARLIPGVDAKLGLNWNVPYAYEKTNFGIEAGYQVAYYWTVIDQVTFPSGTDGLSHNYSSYGNMGPYLNFTAMF